MNLQNPRKRASTNIDQLLLRAGQARTSVRRFGWFVRPDAKMARILRIFADNRQVSGSNTLAGTRPLPATIS